jgi:hypothetical protein
MRCSAFLAALRVSAESTPLDGGLESGAGEFRLDGYPELFFAIS